MTQLGAATTVTTTSAIADDSTHNSIESSDDTCTMAGADELFVGSARLLTPCRGVHNAQVADDEATRVYHKCIVSRRVSKAA
jgi:hypothetical protein